MSWIENFTIAIVEKNSIQIGKLIETMPAFETKDEASWARALIQEALRVMEVQKDETLISMQKIKKTQAFLMSSTPKRKTKVYIG